MFHAVDRDRCFGRRGRGCPATGVYRAAAGARSTRRRSSSRARSRRRRDLHASESRHPLDPLGAEEIGVAVATVRQARQLAESVRFVTVTLKEPSKEAVLRFRAGAPVSREALVVLLDNATGRGYEAVVELGSRMVTRYEALPEGVQPSIVFDEFAECEEAVRSSPEVRAALKKRGIEDLSLVMVDAWSAGHYGNEPAPTAASGSSARSAGCARRPVTTITHGPSRTSWWWST